MISWMLWATGVTLLLALAATLLEWGLRTLGRPGRFAWVGATVGAVVLGAWSLLAPAATPGAGASQGTIEGITVDLIRDLATAVPAPPGLLDRLEAYLPVVWAVSAALLLTAIVGGLWRLARRARSWPAALLTGGEVLISERFGPALVGIWSPRIVVPRWALRLGSERLRMAYRHEWEHRQAGDGLLLLGSALVTAVAPWNPGLWWIHARLRAAVELDCDARVLRAGAHPVAYGSLLLELSARAGDVPPMVAAFARPRATLERRMTMIVRDAGRAGASGYARTAVAVAAASLLVVVACEAPAPTAPSTESEASRAVFEAQERTSLEREWHARLQERTSAPQAQLRGAVYRMREVAEGDRHLPEAGDDVWTPRPEDQANLMRRFPEGVERMYYRVGPRETAADREMEAVRLRRLTGEVDAASPQPLVYVDGIRVEGGMGSLQELVPSRIERIEIVKGDAATALFGEAATAGVVQIFLKQGS